MCQGWSMAVVYIALDLLYFILHFCTDPGVFNALHALKMPWLCCHGNIASHCNSNTIHKHNRTWF